MSDLSLLAADALLVLHSLFVAFVVCGLLLVIVGGLRGWAWVHNRWFRLAHLVAIGCVVVQSWLGLVCPLTTWEMALRVMPRSCLSRCRISPQLPTDRAFSACWPTCMQPLSIHSSS